MTARSRRSWPSTKTPRRRSRPSSVSRSWRASRRTSGLAGSACCPGFPAPRPESSCATLTRCGRPERSPVHWRGAPPMSDEVVKFTIDALRQMNFDVEDADADTVFGPAGVDLDSMAVAELALRVEDAYGVKFGEEDMDRLAIMTIGEFADEVVQRGKTTESVSQ